MRYYIPLLCGAKNCEVGALQSGEISQLDLFPDEPFRKRALCYVLLNAPRGHSDVIHYGFGDACPEKVYIDENYPLLR